MTKIWDSAFYRGISWCLAPVLLFVPFLWLGLDETSFGKSDALFYANILAMMADALKSGDFFPRWFAEANAGYGSPVMLFYSPLAYSISAIVNLPLTWLHLSARTQLFVGIYASQVASGITMWWWLKTRFSPGVAYMGSLLFVLLPFKYVYIFLYANLAQLWALAFLPLWMLAAETMLERGWRSVAFYAFAFAAVYYSHPPTLIVFGIVPALYVVLFGGISSCWRLLFAHVLGLALCLMQALPQHYYLDWINLEGFLKRFYWQDNFLHADAVAYSYYAIIAMVVVWLAGHLPKLHHTRLGKEVVFWAATIFIIVFFLTQESSLILWEWIPALKYLQFPALRFHVPALIGAVFLMCVWVAYRADLKPLNSPVLQHYPITLALLIIIFGTFTFQQRLTSYAALRDVPQNVRSIYPLRLIEPPEYATHWGCLTRPFIQQLKNDYPHQQNAFLARLQQGKGVLSVSWNPPQRIILEADITSEKALLVLHQCYLPLWQAYDESGHPIALSPVTSEGLLGLTLPAGHHTVEIVFTSGVMENLGRLASAFALCICLILLLDEKAPRGKSTV